MLDETFIIRIPVILLALTVHEFAHGWAALKLGDPTAQREGRLTLNPIPHLDLLGTIMLMTGLFGWAKPVPVNPYNLRDPKRDLIYISFAGPLSNIILAIVFGLVIRALIAFDPGISFLPPDAAKYFSKFLWLGFFINCGLAFFNLLPFPPLDGSKIVAGFLPDKHVRGYMDAAKYALPIIFGLVLIGAFTGYPILSYVLNPVFQPFIKVMTWIAVGT